MTYEVRRINGRAEAYPLDASFDPERLSGVWAEMDEADITDYPWLGAYPYHCRACARVGMAQDGLAVLMYAWETPVISRETCFGGSPCEDSCMEFFVSPFPEKTQAYLNIEINPSGIAHVGYGRDRFGRFVHAEPVKDMDIRTCVREGELWAVSFTVPFSLIERHFGAAPLGAKSLKGNFYKCSGPLLHEHYGCWNHVGTEKPDFHRPEYFGDLIIAE